MGSVLAPEVLNLAHFSPKLFINDKLGAKIAYIVTSVLCISCESSYSVLANAKAVTPKQSPDSPQ